MLAGRHDRLVGKTLPTILRPIPVGTVTPNHSVLRNHVLPLRSPVSGSRWLVLDQPASRTCAT